MCHSGCMQKSSQKWVIIGAVAMALITGTVIYDQLSGSNFASAPEVNWENLAEFDILTGTAPASLKVLDHQKVKIPDRKSVV